MTLTPRILIIPVVLAGLLVSAAVTAQPLAPQEILFVPWGDGADEVRYQQEPGGRFGPQSFRIGDDGSTVSLLDPLAQQLKTFTDGRLIAGTEIPTGCRDFLNASSDETYFLAGDQVLHARHGALVSRSGQTAGRPTIQGLVRRGDSLVALHHDGTFTELSPRTRTTTYPLTARAIRHSADLAEILFVQPDGTIDRSFDLPVASDNLGSLRVIGRDDAGRIFVDMHLVERAVPLAVRREVWVLSESGVLLGTLHLPTHYFTRLFRDLELTTDGDLYHLISAEDGLHVLKWSLQGIAGGGELGRYPAAFQTKVHYNNLQDDDPYARDLSDPGYTQQRATATRAEALATGETYAQHSWTATATNISNGVVMAPDGDLVETPDWIVIGLNDRIPYKWGGTDTLEEYDLGIAAGNYAGDIDTDGSSAYARGVDCSGFVCRCWNTDQDYTTREMVDPAYGPITLPYSHWEDLLPGDAVHREGHVRMAVESFADGSILVVEAAGSATNWCVGYVTYMLADLEGYSPRYYVEMDGAPVFDTITSASVNGYWTDTTTWVGGVVPTCDDNVVIAAGDTVIVAEYDAACKDLSFGGNSAQIKMYSTSRLNVYGDFTLYSTSHCVFDEYWSSNDAKIRFTGSAVQTLRGWNPSSGSTSFRDVIVDKDGGRLTTDGTDMRLGIQNSLEIVNGRFELAAGDDLEGRWATSGNYTGSDLPNVIIHAGAEFDMLEGDGAHHMRSDYDSGVSTPIGVFTIYGSATFRDGSTIEINLSGIDIEAGGKLLTSTGMGSGQFDCGPLHIKPGGELENYTTSDCWGTSAVVTLDEGGLFDTKASVTVFPANFTNNGTVRYSREGTIEPGHRRYGLQAPGDQPGRGQQQELAARRQPCHRRHPAHQLRRHPGADRRTTSRA